MSQVFDPYSSWLDIPARDHPPNHYALLGLRPFEPDQRVIRQAAQQRAEQVRPHRAGEHADVCQRILCDLSAATGCLLDPGKKSDYDRCLCEAERMDDTRSMSEADLEVEAEGAEPKPLRWGDGTARDSAAATRQPRPRDLDRDEPDADSQSSFGSDSSAGSSSGGLTKIESAVGDERQPLINVVVVSSGVGILLVAALGLVIGVLVTGRGNSADESPGGSSPLTLVNGAESPGGVGNRPDSGQTNPPPAGESRVGSEAIAVDETAQDADSGPGTSPDDETTGDPPSDSKVSAEESETVALDSSSTPPSPARFPLPPLEEHARLLAQVEAEIGVEQLTTRKEFLDLAGQLIDGARESAQSPDRHFGHLLKAARLAGEAGDPVLAILAVDEIRSVFEISDAQIEELLADLLGDGLDAGSQRWQRFVDARQELTANPADPPANLEIGRYYCFLRDDWPRGLPHLAGGENTALRLLAEKELADTATWQQRLELGDGWWAVSLVAGPEVVAAQRERAARWYRLALPDLDGPAKRRIQSRLASLIALPNTVAPDDAHESTDELPPEEPDGGQAEPTALDAEQPLNLSGTWRSDRFGTVFRLDDRGSTVRCEVVSSKMVGHVDGLWIREKGRLLCDRWRFRFVEDPDSERTWDLGCEPKVVDEKTILLRAEVVQWDRRGRETNRDWETATWKKESS